MLLSPFYVCLQSYINTQTKYRLYQAGTHDLDNVPTTVPSIRYLTIFSRSLLNGSPRSDSPYGRTAVQPRIDSVWYVASRPWKYRDQSGRDRPEWHEIAGVERDDIQCRGRDSGMSAVMRASPCVCEDPTRRLLSTQGDQRASVMSGVSNLFFSRSAPATNRENHDHAQAHGRDHTHLRGATMDGDAKPGRNAWLVQNTTASGSYVKVLDLGPVREQPRFVASPLTRHLHASVD